MDGSIGADVLLDRLERLVKVAPVVLIEVDLEGTITLLDGAPFHTAGNSATRFLGRSIFDVCAKHRKVADQVRRALAGKPNRSAARVQSDAGSIWDLQFNARRATDGTVVAAVGTGVEVTARVRAEAAAQEAASARTENESKALLLRSVSHEVRTPLNAMLGFAQLLEEGVYGPLNDRQQLAVDRIRRGGDHLLRLIGDVLDYAKLNAGALTVFPEPLPVTDAIHDVRERLAPLAQTSELTIVVQGEDAAIAMADPVRVAQILTNVIGNAIKFTPRGGTISVAARVVGAVVEVNIEDTGPGISPEHRNAIFDDFVQLGNTRERRQGTGLGLPLSRRLARLMGGDLTLANQRGAGGARFELTLPAAA